MQIPSGLDDWNDFRLILAISRSGSLTGSAQSLGINHSTAFRRLNAAEERVGVRLFERLPAGVYLPTPAGERMAETAERIETETAALGREIAGHDHRLTGQLRVTSSDTLASRLVTSHFARFRQMHPGIVVELTVDNRVLSLSRREADIALRPARPREGDLFGRKLADIAWAVYGAPSLLMRRSPLKSPAELADMPMIGWSADANGIPGSEWLSARVTPTAWVYRSNSLINQFMAAKAGIGLAVLPCYLADPDLELRRAITMPIAELMRELWIVTHGDLRRTARVRAFFDVVGDGLAAERALFAGEHPQVG